MPLAQHAVSWRPMGIEQPTRPLTAYLVDRAGSSAPAFTHIDYSSDRAGVEHTISWAELAGRVRAAAAAVAEFTGPSERVALLAQQDLNYVVGFLATLHAGRVAVPLFAPETNQHGQRLTNALADCAPQLWLTSRATASSVHALADDATTPPPEGILAVDEIGTTGASFEPKDVDLAATAYLQYTSGSTRTPAGAMISHRAAVTNSWQSSTAFGVDSSWTSAGWIPFFHDMGLIQLLCLPVLTGARSVFMTPFDFIAKPVRWLHQLSSFDNVLTAAPNFAFDYAARKVSERDRAKLDLSGVRVMINGSEPVKQTTIRKFEATFGPCGLTAAAQRPSYGLAEATVFVTNSGPAGSEVTAFDRAALADGRAVARELDDPNAIRLVSAGGPHDQRVAIVDPTSHVAVVDDVVGEIWVHGPNVADGYWRQPERSAETFDASLHNPPAGLPPTGWLRSGDLGVCHQGSLYVTGRIKDLIIIDGKNHYPQDIEATVSAAHPGLRAEHVAAFSVPGPDDVESAGVVAESHDVVEPGSPEHEEIVSAVRKAVNSVHDVSLRGVVLAPAGSVRRTSSGKLARTATRDEFWDGS